MADYSDMIMGGLGSNRGATDLMTKAGDSFVGGMQTVYDKKAQEDAAKRPLTPAEQWHALLLSGHIDPADFPGGVKEVATYAKAGVPPDAVLPPPSSIPVSPMGTAPSAGGLAARPPDAEWIQGPQAAPPPAPAPAAGLGAPAPAPAPGAWTSAGLEAKFPAAKMYKTKADYDVAQASAPYVTKRTVAERNAEAAMARLIEAEKGKNTRTETVVEGRSEEGEANRKAALHRTEIIIEGQNQRARSYLDQLKISQRENRGNAEAIAEANVLERRLQNLLDNHTRILNAPKGVGEIVAPDAQAKARKMAEMEALKAEAEELQPLLDDFFRRNKTPEKKDDKSKGGGTSIERKTKSTADGFLETIRNAR